MNGLQQWWVTLVKREQIIVIVLMIIVTLFTLQSVIITPVYQKRDNARNSVEKQADLLQWMKQRAHLAKNLKQSPSNVVNRHQSVSQQINTAAKRNKLEISRFQTSGDDGVQVWLDNTAFSKLILWLDTLHKQGVKLESISISETSKKGIISARISLSK